MSRAMDGGQAVNLVAPPLTTRPARPGVGLLRWHSGLLDVVVQIGDGLLCALALLVVQALFPFDRLLPRDGALVAATLVLPLAWVFALRTAGAYRLLRYRRLALAARDAVTALALLGGALLLAVELLDGAGWAERGPILGWAALLLAATLAARAVLRVAVERGLTTGTLRRQVAIIGATDIAESVVETLTRDDEPNPVNIIGVFDDRRGTRVAPNVLGHALIGSVADLCEAARHERVDLIVICLPWSRAMQIFATMQEVQWIAADIMVPLDPDTFNLRAARVRPMAGQQALEVMRQPLQDGAVLVKMAEDYVLATLLLIAAAPVMLLCALAIRLDSPGPVLFRQRREGFNGQDFTIFKFRTMTAVQHDPTIGVVRRDPRVTRIGRILRRFHLDELPQLLNVLRGDMSLVGPRPYVQGMQVGADDFKRAVRDYAIRYRVKPGLTGLAQVNGIRGRIDTVEAARRGIELDIRYVQEWTLLLDLKILFRTVLVCLGGRNAH
ncbi:exopolysaccharide biosynthesis polyprenyl glycosylphosphotransferase [Roseomonas sp. CCTCC AB2023176]|uniref:exopolysaccharide biosynthesis polyprenyl glycosylphosphotransferase n=1 Tax=Roseomonas sp. CCTCC AB2023176 TaxID=3342640 RepID=UPI0035DE51EB